MENTKKRRNYVVPWLFCSIVVIISIFYLFSQEYIISGQIEVTTRSLLTMHKSAKVKRGMTRKISKNKTVEPSSMSKNETVEPSKISKNKRIEPLKKSKNKTVEPSQMSKNETVEPSKISKNKSVEPLKKSKNQTVEPPDDSEYQSEYICNFNCNTTI